MPTSGDQIKSGSFSHTTSGATASPQRITVATFNIRYGVGSFLITGSLLRRLRISRPSRRHALIERHLNQAAQALRGSFDMPPVDILALQEADAGTMRAARHQIAPELAALLSMHYAFTNMNTPRDVKEQAKKWYLDFEEHIASDDEGDTGVALLSRLPFDAIERIDLPWSICPWRPRLGIYGKFFVNSTPVHIFNSHIDTHAATDAQLSQHEAILTRAERFAARGEPTILTGDFNTLTRKSAIEVRRFLEARGYTTPFVTGTTTWRAGLIRLHTDWIFTRNLNLTRHGVLRPLNVSDHFPVWIEIDTSQF